MFEKFKSSELSLNYYGNIQGGANPTQDSSGCCDIEACGDIIWTDCGDDSGDDC